MKELRTFEIILAGHKSAFLPGDEVSGLCIIDLNKEIKLKSICVSLDGSAKVYWTETKHTSVGENSTNDSRTYSKTVKYFSMKQPLYGNPESNVESTLNARKYEFSFTFVLPRDLPSSYKSHTGNIRYILEAKIKRGFFSSNEVRNEIFVDGSINVNHPDFQHPVEHSVKKSVGCCCIKSGNVSFDAVLDKTGVCSGEVFEVSAIFNNHSSREVCPLVSLKRIQTFLAEGHSKKSFSSFQLQKGPNIKSRSDLTWDRVKCPLPHVPPTVHNCSIIKNEYFLEIELVIPYSRNLSLKLPLTVGTYVGALLQ